MKKRSFIPAIYFSLLLISFFSLHLEKADTTFDRTMNLVNQAGLSLSWRITSFYGFYLLLFPVLFLVSYYFFRFTLKEKEQYLSFLYELIAVTCCLIPVYFLSNASGIKVEGMLLPAIACSVALAGFLDFRNQLTKNDLYMVFILSLSESLSLRLLFDQFLNRRWMLIFGFPIIVILFLLQCLLFRKKEQKVCHTLVQYFSWLPAVLCFIAELSYILIGRGIRFSLVRFLPYFSVLLFIAILICVLLRKKFVSEVSYLGFIISIGAVSWMPDFSKTLESLSYPGAFELANISCAADTVLTGKLPIIEYFSAHMLSDVWTNLLYYFLNQDWNGLLVNPYLNIPNIVSLVILYCLIKHLFSKELALLVCCFLPNSDSSFFEIGISFVPVFALYYLLKRNTTKSYVIYWSSLLFGVLYKIDDGLGIGIGCIVVPILLACSKHIRLKWKPFITAAAGVSLTAIFIFLLGCIKGQVSFFNRLAEFVHVTLKSNSTWALLSLGDNSTLQYTILYYLLPIITVSILIWLCLELKSLQSPDLGLYSLCVALGISQIIFLSRSLILYTLGNGVTPRFFNYFPWFIAFCVLYLFRAKAFSKRVCIFATTFIAVLLLQGGLVIHEMPTIQQPALFKAYRMSGQKELVMKHTDDTQRSLLGEQTTNLINLLNPYFDYLLKEDETFLDFTNITSIYALTKREKPFYVAQSPSLLTTEYTQRAYLAEIEAHGNVPLAILPAKCDFYIDGMIGIKHSQRYYLVAEYIFQNYRPLVKSGDFALWCTKNKYEEYSTLLIQAGFELLDEFYGLEEGLHTYNLGAFAWLWANHDTKQAIENPVLYEYAANEEYLIRPENVNTQNGNYLALTINLNEDSTREAGLHLLDTDNTVLAQFTFTLYPGQQQYLIRVSSDYVWYLERFHSFSIESDADISVEKVQILIGD